MVQLHTKCVLFSVSAMSFYFSLSNELPKYISKLWETPIVGYGKWFDIEYLQPA